MPNKPASNKPASNKPASNKPASNKPASNKPASNKPRRFPSEDKTDRRVTKPPMKSGTNRPMGMTRADMVADMDPAMRPEELCELERIIESASPEVFQAELSRVLRKMMVRGLREIPPPKSIKELQAIYDMFRKAEGIERADKQGGAVVGGFLPRVVGRRSLGEKVIEYPKERVETTEAEVVSGGEKTDDSGEESPEVARTEAEEFEV